MVVGQCKIKERVQVKVLEQVHNVQTLLEIREIRCLRPIAVINKLHTGWLVQGVQWSIWANQAPNRFGQSPTFFIFW